MCAVFFTLLYRIRLSNASAQYCTNPIFPFMRSNNTIKTKTAIRIQQTISNHLISRFFSSIIFSYKSTRARDSGASEEDRTSHCTDKGAYCVKTGIVCLPGQNSADGTLRNSTQFRYLFGGELALFLHFLQIFSLHIKHSILIN